MDNSTEHSLACSNSNQLDAFSPIIPMEVSSSRRFSPPSRHAAKRLEKLNLSEVPNWSDSMSPSPSEMDNGPKIPRKSVSFEFPLRPEILNYPKEEKATIKRRIKGLNRAVKKKLSKGKSKLIALSSPDTHVYDSVICSPEESYYKKENVDDVIEQICVSHSSSRSNSLGQYTKRRSSSGSSGVLKTDNTKINRTLSSKTLSSEENLSTHDSCASHSSFGRRSLAGIFHRDFLSRSSPISKRKRTFKSKKPFQSIKKIISKESPTLTNVTIDNPFSISRSYDDILRESNFPTQKEYFQDFTSSEEDFQTGDFDDDEKYYNISASRRQSSYSISSVRRPSLYYDQPSRRLSEYSFDSDCSLVDESLCVGSPKNESTSSLSNNKMTSSFGDLSLCSSTRSPSGSPLLRNVCEKLSVVRELSSETKQQSECKEISRPILKDSTFVSDTSPKPRTTHGKDLLCYSSSVPTYSNHVPTSPERLYDEGHSFLAIKLRKIKKRIGLFRSQSDFGPLPNKPPPPKPPRMHQVFPCDKNISFFEGDTCFYFRRFSLVDGDCDKLSPKATTLNICTGHSISKILEGPKQCTELSEDGCTKRSSIFTHFSAKEENGSAYNELTETKGSTLELKNKYDEDLSLSEQIENELQNISNMTPFPVYYPPISPSPYRRRQESVDVNEENLPNDDKDSSKEATDLTSGSSDLEEFQVLEKKFDDPSSERKKSLLNTFFERLVEQQTMLRETPSHEEDVPSFSTLSLTPDTSDSEELMLNTLFYPEDTKYTPKAYSLPMQSSSSYMKFHLTHSDCEIIFFPGMRRFYRRQVRMRRASDTALVMMEGTRLQVDKCGAKSLDNIFDGYSADTEDEGLVSENPVACLSSQLSASL